MFIYSFIYVHWLLWYGICFFCYFVGGPISLFSFPVLLSLFSVEPHMHWPLDVTVWGGVAFLFCYVSVLFYCVFCFVLFSFSSESYYFPRKRHRIRACHHDVSGYEHMSWKNWPVRAGWPCLFEWEECRGDPIAHPCKWMSCVDPSYPLTRTTAFFFSFIAGTILFQVIRITRSRTPYFLRTHLETKIHQTCIYT